MRLAIPIPRDAEEARGRKDDGQARRGHSSPAVEPKAGCVLIAQPADGRDGGGQFSVCTSPAGLYHAIRVMEPSWPDGDVTSLDSAPVIADAEYEAVARLISLPLLSSLTLSERRKKALPVNHPKKGSGVKYQITSSGAAALSGDERRSASYASHPL